MGSQNQKKKAEILDDLRQQNTRDKVFLTKWPLHDIQIPLFGSDHLVNYVSNNKQIEFVEFGGKRKGKGSYCRFVKEAHFEQHMNYKVCDKDDFSLSHLQVKVNDKKIFDDLFPRFQGNETYSTSDVQDDLDLITISKGRGKSTVIIYNKSKSDKEKHGDNLEGIKATYQKLINEYIDSSYNSDELDKIVEVWPHTRIENKRLRPGAESDKKKKSEEQLEKLRLKILRERLKGNLSRSRKKSEEYIYKYPPVDPFNSEAYKLLYDDLKKQIENTRIFIPNPETSIDECLKEYNRRKTMKKTKNYKPYINKWHGRELDKRWVDLDKAIKRLLLFF